MKGARTQGYRQAEESLVSASMREGVKKMPADTERGRSVAAVCRDAVTSGQGFSMRGRACPGRGMRPQCIGSDMARKESGMQ